MAMKDYDHIVIWLDYFNKNLTRAKGRRLPREKCIFEPTMKELTDATMEADLKVVESKDQVRFPRRPYVRSGYVVLPKTSHKTKALGSISRRLVAKRHKKTKKSQI